MSKAVEVIFKLFGTLAILFGGFILFTTISNTHSDVLLNYYLEVYGSIVVSGFVAVAAGLALTQLRYIAEDAHAIRKRLLGEEEAKRVDHAAERAKMWKA